MRAFADGRTTPAAFRGWLAGTTWHLRAHDTPTAHLLHRVEVLVAEHGRRHIRLAKLRARVREAVNAGT
jgi:hypothetical protein